MGSRAMLTPGICRPVFLHSVSSSAAMTGVVGKANRDGQ
jgi:hypothetical protein